MNMLAYTGYTEETETLISKTDDKAQKALAVFLRDRGGKAKRGESDYLIGAEPNEERLRA